MEQHHADMDAAGVGFEDAVKRVQVPNSLPTTAAGERMAASDPEAGAVVPTSNALQDTLRAEHLQGWRPLIGILRRPPPRRDLDARGVPFVAGSAPRRPIGTARWSARRSTGCCGASSGTWRTKRPREKGRRRRPSSPGPRRTGCATPSPTRRSSRCSRRCCRACWGTRTCG
jgi:hypothetical protein